MIKNILGLARKNIQPFNAYKCLFSKEKPAKPQKGGGKKDQGAPAAPPAVVVQELTPEQKMRQYLSPIQNSLSAKQLQIMTQNFKDLSDEEKKMLDSFAEQIIQLKTPSFLWFNKWGGIGTSDSYYFASNPPSEQQLNQSINFLKKQDN